MSEDKKLPPQPEPTRDQLRACFVKAVLGWKLTSAELTPLRRL